MVFCIGGSSDTIGDGGAVLIFCLWWVTWFCVRFCRFCCCGSRLFDEFVSIRFGWIDDFFICSF